MDEKYIDINKLRSNPIPFREKLPKDLEKWARNIHASLGDNLAGPFEKFEMGFCRDLHPIKELFIWNVIASTLKWLMNSPLYNSRREEIFQYLLSFTLDPKSADTEEKKYFKSIMEKIQKMLLEKMRENTKKD